MSKILRLLQDTTDPAAQRDNSLRDWQKPVNNAEYNSAYINAIKDPNGASAAHEITSIPSPFARIDLVKSAFKYVAEHGLDGSSIYHKMVSDSLDVGEIFFKFGNFSNRVKIVYWDRNAEIKKLKESESEGHRILGSTLETYLKQDASAYNFGSMDGIYLLVYTGNASGERVLGAISPRTLFFSIANDLSDLRDEFQFNTDYAFDADYNPLYKRDKKYVEYLFALRNSYNATHNRLFSTHFKEINEYLTKTIARFNGTFQRSLNGITTASFRRPLQIMHNDATHNVRVINGLDLWEFYADPIERTDSDFEITTSRDYSYNGKKPLVLPVEASNQYENWKLCGGNTWDSHGKAPFVDKRAFSDRTLPQTNDAYPYLTISDFLEDYIIRMPYDLNRSAFYNPQHSIQASSFLLPLKDEFFKFFSLEDIKDRNMLEFNPIQGGTDVEVQLHIPVKHGAVHYRRVYRGPLDSNRPIPATDISNNKGAIVDKNNCFGFALMPAIRFVNQEDANYRFVLATEYDPSKYEVRFYDSDFSQIDGVAMSFRNPNVESRLPQNRVFCIENKNLGYIRISDSHASGIIYPELKTVYANEDDFTFAVDFGTTNTHVVYQIGSLSPKTFDVSASDQQIQLNASEQEIRDFIYHDLCPEFIGDDQVCKFPMRSVLTHQKGIDWQQQHFALGEANFSYLYGKQRIPTYNSVKTDIKWNTEDGNDQMIKYYIESLFFAMRNKVLLNNSPLSTVKVYWTYPLAMPKFRKKQFENCWKAAYTKYFRGGNLGNLVAINESIAPYNYHIAQDGGINNIVTIDIGGGTSDIVCVEGDEVQFTTSFRFATNSLFEASKPSGIVRQFLPKMQKALDANKKGRLKEVLTKLVAEATCPDIASFLFSIKENKGCDDIDSLDFSLALQNDDSQKITFLFFYCAIIYHLATIMKAKEFEPPSNIGFSGNGSKIIDALTTDSELLVKLTKKIFEKIYGKSYPGDDLEIVKVRNPKEATSMGAIGATDVTDVQKIILLGTDGETFVSEGMKYQVIRDRQEEYVAKIVTETKKFVELVWSLDGGGISFINDFGIDKKAVDIAKDKCSKRIKDKVEIKLRKKIKEVGLDGDIEETMFFFAIPEILISIEEEICTKVFQNR